MSQLEQFLWRVQRQDNLQYETEISATEPTVAPSDGQPIITSATIILESRFIDNRFEGWINNESSLADPLAVQLNAIDPAGGINLSSGSEGVRVSATNSSPAQSGLLRIFDEGGTESIGITVPSTVTSRTHTIPDTSNDTFVMTNATQTLANKTLTDPRIGNTIFDTNGNELLTFSPTGSAVNEILITNAATGNDPSIIGAGDDANVGLILQSKGTGTIRVASQDAGVSGELRILDNTGGQYVGLTVPGALAGAYTLQLPTDVGTLGQVLSTDGNNPANLSWIDSSSTVTLDSTAGGQSLVFDGTGPDLTIRSLLAGTGIALGLNGNAVEITNTSPGAGTVTLDSTGTGANLVNDGTGPDLAIKSVTAGTGISIVENADDIIITNEDPGSGVTLASTVGDQSLVSDGTGPSLEIRALNAGTGISFAVDGNGSVTVTNTSPGAGTVTLDSTGTGANLVNDGTGPDLAIKSVTAGSGISIVENVNDIVITNDDPASGVTLASTAGDQSLVSDGVGPDLEIRALDAGTGITLALVGDAVEITNNDPGSAVTLTSTGTGADLVNDGTGPDLAIKSVTAGSGISIVENVDDIIITNDDPGSGVTLASTAGDQSLVSDGVGPDLEIRALDAGVGITLSLVGDAVEITNNDPGSAVTLTSAGTGADLVNDGTGPDLAIKSVTAGTGISIVENVDDIIITNDDPGSGVTLASTAGDQSLVSDGVGPDLQVRALDAGVGITLSLVGDAVEITNNDPGSAVTLTSTGTGADLVNDGTGPDLAIKSVTAGTGISIVENVDDIIITNDDPGSGVTLASTAGDQSLVSDGVGPDLQVRALDAGVGITLSLVGDAVEITNNDPGSAVTLTSTGTGVDLVNDGTGPDLAIKSVTAGTGISIIENVDDIVITNGDPASGVTLASTVGEQSLVSDGTGPDLAVRALNAGTGISFAVDGNGSVTITNTSPGGGTVTLSGIACSPPFSPSNEVNLVVNGTGPDLEIRNLNGGDGISLDINNDCVNITNTDPGSGTMDTVTTANNVMTTITTIPTITDTTYFIDARLVARRTDSGTESAGYKLYATYRNNGGTLTQIGNDDLLSQEDTVQWDVDTVISGTNILIQVMGQNGKTIDWKSSWMTINV